MLSRIARLEERLLQSEARFQNSPKPSAAVEESGYGSDTGTATRRPSTTFSASTTSLFSPELMSAGPSPAVINSPEMVSMAEETATEDRTPKKVHVTHAHSVWLWPATQDLLKESSPTAMSDLQYSEIRWLMRRQRPPWAASHSCRPEIETRASPDRGLVTMWFGLSYAQIVDLCNLYFNTFNFLYPFLDRGVFFSSFSSAEDGGENDRFVIGACTSTRRARGQLWGGGAGDHGCERWNQGATAGGGVV
jgi:hypothetical protein